MPKKKATETQEAQSERFREVVRAAIDAGELNPAEADEALEALTKPDRLRTKQQSMQS